MHTGPVSSDLHVEALQRELAAVRQRANLLEDFVEQGAIGLHWVGPDGFVLWANAYELQLLGYTREEYVGHHIAEFHADRAIIDDILSRLSANETLCDYEARLRCKNGDIRIVLINSSVLWQDGRFIHTRCFTRDVTEQKRVEATLRESEHRFRQVADASPVMLWVADPDGMCSFLSRTWCRFTGRSHSSGLGLGRLDAVHPDDRVETVRILLASNAERVPFRIEYRLKRADGVYRWVLDTAAPRIADDGNFLGYVGSVIDIDERKDFENALNAESVRWKMLSEAMPQLVWTCAPDGSCDYLSAQWVAYTGLPAEVQLGGAWIAQVHPDDHADLARVWERAITEIIPFETQFRIRRHDGAYRWFQTRAVPSFAEDGSVLKWFGTNTDITDHVRTREELNRQANELRRVNAELEHFAIIASHDLQEPLRMISSYSDLIVRRSGPLFDEKTHGYFAHITSAALRMRDLVNALLDYSHVDKKPITHSEVSVSAALADALDNLQNEIGKKGADIGIGELPVIAADRVRVSQLLQNLVANALKFSDPHRPLRIRIDSHRDRGIPVVVVRDNGIGISAPDQERIFQIFQRLHAPGRYPGSGVGLATCRKIVEQHGGRIWVESRMGEGSAFFFTLAGA